MNLSDHTFTRAQKRRIKRRWKRAMEHHPENFDHLAARENMACRIGSLAEKGEVTMVYHHQGQHGTSVATIPAIAVNVERWIIRESQEAEGPWWWDMIPPSEYRAMLAAAIQDGLNHYH